MALIDDQPPTTVSHGELPYPRGTAVYDTETGRVGELQGVIEERAKVNNTLIGRTAFMRPKGGGVEWETPLDRIRPVAEDG